MSDIDFAKPWTEQTFVAFDTETSSAYPIGSDIVEFGAVKWRDGKIIDELQILIKPRELMSDFIIGIHGITNEMVEKAPTFKEVIGRIDQFIHGHILMAHHAAFDMGFMAYEYEKNGLEFPLQPVLCTSLISRKKILGCENHKLQTLVRYLGIDGGSAHRALDDARACLYVGLKSFEKIGDKATLQDIYQVQGTSLEWKNFVILGHPDPMIKKIIEATNGKKVLEIVYSKGKGQETRKVKPWGLVRNPDGDYLYALCMNDNSNKRFYLNKIKASVVL
jgi:DNA polymerase-3 subunit epsilon